MNVMTFMCGNLSISSQYIFTVTRWTKDIWSQQVCIPVGCVPTASVTISGGGKVHPLRPQTPVHIPPSVHTHLSTHPLPKCMLGYTTTTGVVTVGNKRFKSSFILERKQKRRHSGFVHTECYRVFTLGSDKKYFPFHFCCNIKGS